MYLWVNTGTVNVNVGSVTTALNYSLLPSNNSFSNTCPFMINWLGDDTVRGVPRGTLQSKILGILKMVLFECRTITSS